MPHGWSREALESLQQLKESFGDDGAIFIGNGEDGTFTEIVEKTTGEYMASLLTPELRSALHQALLWAEPRRAKSLYADSAYAYIKAIEQAMLMETEAGGDAKNALSSQLNYLMANTMYWRGETARENKFIIKKYIDMLKG